MPQHLFIISFRQVRNMKKNVVCIVCSFVILYLTAYYMLRPRSGFAEEFYKQEKNQVDVLFLGSSNAYSNINPAILWQNYGISSFLLCGSGQPIWNSYYYLKEAYKTQKPELVVLEVFTMAANPTGYDELSNLPSNILSLKWSKDKIEAMKVSTNKNDFSDILLGLPIFHNRWSEVFEGDIYPWKYDECNGAMEKGYYPVFRFDSFVQPEYNSEIIQMPQSKHTEYLERIIELAEKNGSQILLIKTPYVLDESYDAIYNGVAEIAQENEVTFINMNEYTEKIGFDFSACMADTVHLNNVGAELVTNFLGGDYSNRLCYSRS